MELLGEYQYFYSEKTKKHYKVVDIYRSCTMSNNTTTIYNWIIQECTLEYIGFTKHANSNPKVFQKIPNKFVQRRQLDYNLCMRLFTDYHTENTSHILVGSNGEYEKVDEQPKFKFEKVDEQPKFKLQMSDKYHHV